MNPELKKLLDAIRAHFATGENKQAFLDALKEGGEYVDLRNDIYQVAFNDGHATATEAHKGAKTKSEEKLAAAIAAKDAAEAALAKLKKDNPDSASLHAEYGKQITELQHEIATLTSTHLSERKSAKKEKIESMVESALLALRVNPFQAKAMAQASRDQYIVGDDLAERILQPEKSTAYAGDVKTQAKALAADLFKQVPKEMIVSKVVGGGPGDSGTTTPETPEANDKRAALQRQKEAGLNKFKTGSQNTGQTQVTPQDEVNRRLGVRTRA